MNVIITSNAWIVYGVILLMVFVFGSLLYASIRQKRQQRQNLLDHGLVPQAKPDPSLIERINGLHPGSRIDNIFFLNKSNYQIYLFDLWTRTNDQQAEHPYSSVAVLSADFNLPRFALFPNIKIPFVGKVMEWAVQRAIERHGFQQFTFPDNPAFDDAFILVGADEAALRKYFDLQRLNQLAQMHYIQVDGAGDLVTFSRMDEVTRSETKKDRVSSQLEAAAQIYTIFR
jgi:hypothetical protein